MKLWRKRKPAAKPKTGTSPSDTPEFWLGLAKANPELGAEMIRGEERRLELERERRNTPEHRVPISPGPPTPLHAHEITPMDAAMIRMMARGASFADGVTVVLPSGKTITGAEMQLWLDSHQAQREE